MCQLTTRGYGEGREPQEAVIVAFKEHDILLGRKLRFKKDLKPQLMIYNRLSYSECMDGMYEALDSSPSAIKQTNKQKWKRDLH